MSQRNRIPIITPRILVLEGLWGDAAQLINAAGGHGTEESPWTWYTDARREMLSGAYDGLILTGGSDIDPALYGEEVRNPYVYGVDPVRDAVEYDALSIAEDQGIPVLGICRGSQIMTAYRGGSLVQHIGTHHQGCEHHVFAEPDAVTYRRAINSRDMRVISLHHQCVRRPGRGMRIAARCVNGTPEAVESKDGLWLGVQYHPEMNGFENGNSFAIFQWLVSTAARVAGGRALQAPFRVVRQEREERILRARAQAAEDRAQSADAWRAAGYEQPQTTARIPRKAGDPSIPSMRAGSAHAASIEELERSLLICPVCAMEFDVQEDRDDHLALYHYEECPHCGLDFDNIEQLNDHLEVQHRSQYVEPFDGAEKRYPELEPPPGHPAWDAEGEAVEDDDYLTDRYGQLPPAEFHERMLH